jgi:hypothetical protein
MSVYTLQVHMSTSGRVRIIHSLYGMRFQIPLTPRKCTILNGNFVFDLSDVFQKRNPGVIGDLFVFTETLI